MQEIRGSNPLISAKDFGQFGGFFFLLNRATAEFAGGFSSKIYFLIID